MDDRRRSMLNVGDVEVNHIMSVKRYVHHVGSVNLRKDVIITGRIKKMENVSDWLLKHA